MKIAMTGAFPPQDLPFKLILNMTVSLSDLVMQVAALRFLPLTLDARKVSALSLGKILCSVC